METAPAYGRRAWRITVPPVTTAALAIRVGSADTPPALSSWTEPALSSHNRQLAIFITAVAALIAAAMLITGGLAVLIGHSAPRWVAISLFLLLLSWLSSSGTFDGSVVLRVGGPYGLHRHADHVRAGGGRAPGQRHCAVPPGLAEISSAILSAPYGAWSGLVSWPMSVFPARPWSAISPSCWAVWPLPPIC